MACFFAVRVQNLLSFTRFAVQSFGRAEKKSWYIGLHKKQLRVAPLRRSEAEIGGAGLCHGTEICHWGRSKAQKP
jgi:hypothetical protein